MEKVREGWRRLETELPGIAAKARPVTRFCDSHRLPLIATDYHWLSLIAHLRLQVSEPLLLNVDGEGCGRWMPLECRMCASQLIDQGAADSAAMSTFYNGEGQDSNTLRA